MSVVMTMGGLGGELMCIIKSLHLSYGCTELRHQGNSCIPSSIPFSLGSRCTHIKLLIFQGMQCLMQHIHPFLDHLHSFCQIKLSRKVIEFLGRKLQHFLMTGSIFCTSDTILTQTNASLHTNHTNWNKRRFCQKLNVYA
ncbi:hypothetical protein PR048_018722 [Dryococelus australis]|uniref:Uncharacterized protein n=1 Tax=Dryococelus australis TaxID=614101 RepID=A0ABQ9HD98_9NEOP|nr:hypothetical protein PR048_018722 [Dryococelus australis]